MTLDPNLEMHQLENVTSVYKINDTLRDNATNKEIDDTGYDRDENLAQIEIATLAIIFVVTMFGNVLVLLALYARRRCGGRKKLSRMYYFILHLSIADLITAFFNVLPQLSWEITYRFSGGPMLCKAVKFGQTLGPYLSSYVLLATALDRFQAICHPLTYCSWTSRRSRTMVWLAWAFSLTFCIPQVTIFSYQVVAPGVSDCWATFAQPWGQKVYVTWYSVSVFIIPLCVLVFTYTCICREIWHNAGFRPVQSSGTTPLRLNPLISRAKINTVKQMVSVIAFYIFCSTPFICAQLWSTWDPHAYQSPFWTGTTFTILTLLSSLNSCVNPWIYLTFNVELVGLLKLLSSCSGPEAKYNAGNSAGSGSFAGPGSDTWRSRCSKFANTVLQRQDKGSLDYNNSPTRDQVTSSFSIATTEQGGSKKSNNNIKLTTTSIVESPQAVTEQPEDTMAKNRRRSSTLSDSKTRFLNNASPSLGATLPSPLGATLPSPLGANSFELRRWVMTTASTTLSKCEQEQCKEEEHMVTICRDHNRCEHGTEAL